MSTTRVGRARSPRARAIPAPRPAVSKPAQRPAVSKPAQRPGVSKPAQTPAGPRTFRLPDGSRAAQSPWVWRGHLLMSLVALGICLTFAVGHDLLFAVAWGVIAAGWFGISMWVWRRHLRATS